MARCKELLEKIRKNPKNVRFEDLCSLAECYGYRIRKKEGGSHRIYKKPGAVLLMNFQDVDGKAKPYQVRELLRAIEEAEDE
jgi:hypothetical protein